MQSERPGPGSTTPGGQARLVTRLSAPGARDPNIRYAPRSVPILERRSHGPEFTRKSDKAESPSAAPVCPGLRPVAQVIQPWQVPLAALAGRINRQQLAAIDFLREETRILRDRLGDRRIRLSDDPRRRLAVAGKAVGRKALPDLAGLVTPDTILAWHRKPVAAKWDRHEKRRGPGRPGVMVEIARLVVRFAGENPNADEHRIERAPADLGHRVARTTAAHILKRNGLDPAPERGSRTSWSTVRLPARSANSNAWIERFIRFIKSECLDRMIYFGEESLRRAVR